METQVFDWGRLNWLSEPLVTAAEHFSCGVVELAPGKGHVRHNHPYSEEILYVIEGTGIQTVELESGKLEKEIGPGGTGPHSDGLCITRRSTMGTAQ